MKAPIKTVPQILLLFITAALAPELHAQPATYNWTTIAGVPAAGNINGTNNTARFTLPNAVTQDSAGNIYVVNGDNTIRKLTPVGTNWVSSTIAGMPGTPGSADGIGSAALFNNPSGITIDTNGNLYVVDSNNKTIRMLTPSGTNWLSSTIAGSPGVSGTADGTNSTVQFQTLGGITLDAVGNLYIADGFLLRTLTLSGTNWVSGTIPGLHYYQNAPKGLAFDNAGNLYIADAWTINKLTPTGTNWVLSFIAGKLNYTGSADGTNSDIRFYYPSGITVDGNTNIYVSDTYNSTIRLLTPVGTNWISSTLAGTAGTNGSADGTNNAALFFHPQSITLDHNGNLLIADTLNNTIRKLTLDGTNWGTSTIAGLAGSVGITDGTNTVALFDSPSGIAVDSATNLYVTDTQSDTIRKLTPVGSNWLSSTIAGQPFVVSDNNGTIILGNFTLPQGIAMDSAGNLYIADTGDYAIRKLTLAGTNYTARTISDQISGGGFPSSGEYTAPQGVTVDKGGNVYVADTGDAAIGELGYLAGFSYPPSLVAGPSSPATGSADGNNSSIRFNNPVGIVVDARTNIYVVDSFNNTIRKLTQLTMTNSGHFQSSTIAGLAGNPGSADGTNNAARFFHPTGIALDAHTNLYVADNGNSTIRKLALIGTNWVSTTIGGVPGGYGFSDGANNNARFANAYGIAVDASGNVYVTDTGNNTVRMAVYSPAPLPPLKASLASPGTLQLQLSGTTNQTYILQTATNLTPPVHWQSVATNTADTNGIWSFTDSNLPATTNRYYRVTVPPQ